MEEKTNFEKGQEQETQERQSAFDFAVLYRTIILKVGSINSYINVGLSPQ